MLCSLFVFLVLLYYWTGNDAYWNFANLVLASLFTALGVSRPQPQQQSNVENVEKMTVNAPAIEPTSLDETKPEIEGMELIEIKEK